MSFLIGLIIAQQAGFYLQQFGADLFVVDLSGVLILREIGVLLAAMRRPQSVTAWRAMSPLIRRLLWNHRASLLAPLIPKKKDKGAEDATPPEPFPPPPANAPGEKPYPFLEKASTCLLRTAAETLPELRAEASSCVRALLEAADLLDRLLLAARRRDCRRRRH